MTVTMRMGRAGLTLSTVLGGAALWVSGGAALWVSGGAALWAQEPIGSVSLNDATVTGALRVSGGRAQMLGGTTLTAGSHTAQMVLARGGSVAVCATSALHVTSGQSAPGVGPVVPLLLALDRGAIEVHMQASPRDAIMTPDMLFAILRPGALDLRLRVTNSGDTCVENRGGGAPSLAIQSQFGDGSYELHAGQHVLFEHGSLKEVVDHESSPCGCPAVPVVSVADAGTTSTMAAQPGANVAAAEHPFPAAESQGLTSGTATTPVAAAPSKPGDVHAQVAATLAYDPNATGPRRDSLAEAPPAAAAANGSDAGGGRTGSSSAAASDSGRASAPVARAEIPEPEAPPVSHGLGHRIGRFFKRIFGAS